MHKHISALEFTSAKAWITCSLQLPQEYEVHHVFFLSVHNQKWPFGNRTKNFCFTPTQAKKRSTSLFAKPYFGLCLKCATTLGCLFWMFDWWYWEFSLQGINSQISASNNGQKDYIPTLCCTTYNICSCSEPEVSVYSVTSSQMGGGAKSDHNSRQYYTD